MIVAEEHRCKGVGNYILARAKAFCYERGAVPICSCEAGNIGSKKAIIKAGFVSRHRIVLTQLSAVRLPLFIIANIKTANKPQENPGRFLSCWDRSYLIGQETDGGQNNGYEYLTYTF